MKKRVTRRRVYARDGGCVLCGTNDDLTLHHIRPQVLGGSHELRNLVTLCRPCHDRLELSIGHIGHLISAVFMWLISWVWFGLGAARRRM